MTSDASFGNHIDAFISDPAIRGSTGILGVRDPVKGDNSCSCALIGLKNALGEGSSMAPGLCIPDVTHIRLRLPTQIKSKKLRKMKKNLKADPLSPPPSSILNWGVVS